MPIRPEDKARYPKDWKLRSRFVRFYRARNKCEWCGARNYEPHPETGSKVVLTTAHVFDHNPENAALWNLAALCQKCHNNHDAPHRARRRRERLYHNQLEMFTRGDEMKEMKEIDHEDTSEVVCPYCGHKQSDTWELTGGDDEEDTVNCGKCEKEFGYRTEITIDFTSWKLKEE